MIVFPCCKINLGLNVVAKRPDGYHDIETVFFPVPLHDALEVTMMDEKYPSDVRCDLLVKTIENGQQVESILCPEQDNLVVKAYNILAKDYDLPRIHAHLIKYIPSQAGLGGGSSDAAAMICLLNEQFHLGIDIAKMQRYAARLGADCAFFISSKTAYATGIGEILKPLDNKEVNINGYYLALIKPDVAVSTGKAYGQITPQKPSVSCEEIIKLPVKEWKHQLVNDFEKPVFAAHPILGEIKDKLYALGADFALMSGSGSTVFGLFRDEPKNMSDEFPNMFAMVVKL